MDLTKTEAPALWRTVRESTERESARAVKESLLGIGSGEIGGRGRRGWGGGFLGGLSQACPSHGAHSFSLGFSLFFFFLIVILSA